MRKKTLVILLIIPFVIALLTFVSVVALTNTVAQDISSIRILNYRKNEGFKINGEYKLEAEYTFAQENGLKRPDADKLIWNIVEDNVGDSVASIVEKDGEPYLKTGANEGQCTIRVTNRYGQQYDQITAHIYDQGIVLINTVNEIATNRVDPTLYYGEYDFKYSGSNIAKEKASIPLDISVIDDSGTGSYNYEASQNIDFNRENSTINIKDGGESFLTITSTNASYLTNTFSFEVVDEAINVYSFDDLMNCTNKSQNGETVVMQVNLQSRDNALKKDENGNYIDEYLYENTKLFGNYDFNKQTFNFNDFIYTQDPKIDLKFVKQFLDKGNLVQGFEYSQKIKVGIRVQKDFYGNGFTINMHDLAYPVHGKIDNVTGKLTPDRELDYFFGPLTFVSIGDIENIPVVRAYLCDNVGLLVDGNGIIVNDVKLQNSNNVDNMFNLGFTGTVLEAQGKNITIQNSLIQNGRTCIRAFSTDGLLIDNCLLQNAGEFIVKLGSNKINPTNHNKQIKFSNDFATVDMSFSEFFDSSAEVTNSADYLFTQLFSMESLGDTEADIALDILNEIQKGLDNYDGIINSDNSKNYDAHITINDTYFYNSGIYSIAFETSFNGTYLYNGMPSLVKQLASMFGITPEDIGGTSYPVELKLSGDTRFYDWKDVDTIDSNSLIEANFGAYIGDITSEFEGMGDLSIDSFFPMKAILKEYCTRNKIAYYETDDEGKMHYYVNRPIAWYGGGYNGSDVIINIDENEYYSFSDKIPVDIADDVIHGRHVPWSSELFSSSTLAKCVLAAIGTHPFQFMTNSAIENNEKPILFDEVPSLIDLSNRIAR